MTCTRIEGAGRFWPVWHLFVGIPRGEGGRGGVVVDEV